MWFVLLYIYYILYVVLGGGVFVLCLVVFPGGLPEWGHLSKLGLGSGCSGSFGCPRSFVRRSVFGSTIVLEGVV